MASKYVGEFEGMRGILAAWVVIGHSFASLPMGHSQEVASMGNVNAVDVFIILSGFVIFSLLDSPRPTTYWRYMTARFFRLYPVYLLVLLASIAVLPFTAHVLAMAPLGTATTTRLALVTAAHTDLPAHIAAHLVMLHGLVPEHLLHQTAFTLVGQAWSISVEWQFYIIAPLLFFWLTRLDQITSWVGLAVVLAFCVVYGHYTESGFFGNNLSMFSVGFASYFAFKMNFWSISRAAMRWSFAACFVVGGLLMRNEFIGLTVWLGVFYAVMSARRTGVNPVTAFLMSKPAIYLGRISYSLYMVHILVLMGWIWVLRGLGVPVAAQYGLVPTGCLLLSIGVATAMHHLVEAPFHAFGKMVSARASGPIAVVG